MTFGKPERHSREKMSFKDSAPPGVIIPFLLNSRFPPQSRERLWPDRQSALHLLMVMTASKETAVVMGFRFFTVLTPRLRSGGQRHFNLFPRSRRGDCGGWGTFLGCGAACLLIGWRGPRPPNHISLSNTPQRAAATHAHSGTSACASASWELRAPAQGGGSHVWVCPCQRHRAALEPGQARWESDKKIEHWPTVWLPHVP